MAKKMTARDTFIVFTNSEDEADEEFNRWYDDHHIHEILGVDGFVWGQRYVLHSDQRPGVRPAEWKYLTIYEIDGDVAAINERLAAASPGFVKSPALKQDSVAWVFSPIGGRVEPKRG